MKRTQTYVRQAPKIYGNLQKTSRPPRDVRASLRRFLSIGFILAIVYSLWFSGWFTIKDVQIEGASFTPLATVQATVPMGDNIWFFPKDQITTSLLTLPTVDSVQVLRGIPHGLRIVVTEKQPALLWVSQGKTTVLDARGIAFMQYPSDQVPGSTTQVGERLAVLPQVIDTKNLPVEVGKPTASTNFIHFVTAMQSSLRTTIPNYSIDRVEIADSTYQVTFVMKQGLQAQFNTLDDPGVQSRNLARLITQNKISSTSKVNLSIDRWAYVQ